MSTSPARRSAGRLISLQAAADRADVHPITLRRWIAAGHLLAYRVGPRLLKVDVDALDQVIQRVPTTTQPAAD